MDEQALLSPLRLNPVLLVARHLVALLILLVELLLVLDKLNNMQLTLEMTTPPRQLDRALRCKVDVPAPRSTASLANKAVFLLHLNILINRLSVAILSMAAGLVVTRALIKTLVMAVTDLTLVSALTAGMVAAEVGMAATVRVISPSRTDTHSLSRHHTSPLLY